MIIDAGDVLLIGNNICAKDIDRIRRASREQVTFKEDNQKTLVPYHGDTSKFFGKTIVTPNRAYELNSYGQLVNITTSPIDVEQIAGLDSRICSFAINNPERGPTREELRLLIEKYGKRPQIGRGLAILLSQLDAEKRGCKVNYLIDFPILEIK